MQKRHHNQRDKNKANVTNKTKTWLRISVVSQIAKINIYNRLSITYMYTR